VNAKTTTAQIRLHRVSPAYWRITFNNPPLNVMGPQFVQEFREVVTAIEDDEQVKVVVFDSAVEGYFLNHSDFLANFEDLKRIPAGPTGLEAWPDGLVRLTRAPVVSNRLDQRARHRERQRNRAGQRHDVCQSGEGRALAVGSGHRLGRRRRAHGAAAAADRARTCAGGAPQFRRHRGRVGRGLWLCEPALPDAELDGFVDALATRIAGFEKWAIANTKRLVNASLPPDVEIAAGWDACMASVGRPATQARIKAFFELGFHKPGEAEDRLGAYLGRLGR